MNDSGSATDASSLPPLSREQVQRVTMMESIAGKPFEDVKFFAFSRRNIAGAIDTPLPLSANCRHIRRASSHFDASKLCSI